MHRYLRVLVPLVIGFSAFLYSCTKIDTTTLGEDLIPAVDNVTTFADTLLVEGTQGLFGADSARLGAGDLHVLGNISNDPVFGKTSANLYLELRPAFYPYYFGVPGDSISNGIPGTGFDSAVLCLSYKSFYGDTNLPQRFKIYVIDQANDNFVKDSSYGLNFVPNGGVNGLGLEVGSGDVYAPALKNYTFFYPAGTKRDSVNNQIRITLNQDFMNNFVKSWDTTPGGTNMYLSDSLFRSKIKGLAVVPDQNQGNGLFYVNVSEAATRLEVHFRSRNKGKIDTSYSSFSFRTASTSTTTRSAHASSLIRDRTGAEYDPLQPTGDVLYLQTTPGTYANLRIPALDNFANSIIHRAELFIEQIPPAALDKALAPPSFLYLDLMDPAIAGANPYKPIYVDLNPQTLYNPDIVSSSAVFFPGSGIDFNYYGGFLRSNSEPGGVRNYYKFNLARYIQRMVTTRGTNYQLRLSAPYNLYYYGFTIPYRNSIGAGRVKVGNGNYPDPKYRMGLRLVYSKI